jgi:hypothetical protein
MIIHVLSPLNHKWIKVQVIGLEQPCPANQEENFDHKQQKMMDQDLE